MYELVMEYYRFLIVLTIFHFISFLLYPTQGSDTLLLVFNGIIFIISFLTLLFWKKYNHKFRTFLSILNIILGFVFAYLLPFRLEVFVFFIGMLLGINVAFKEKRLHHGVKMLNIISNLVFKDKELNAYEYVVCAFLYLPVAVIIVGLMYVFYFFPIMIVPDFWNNIILPLIFFGHPPKITFNIFLSIISTISGFVYGAATSYSLSYLLGGDIFEDVASQWDFNPEIITSNFKYINTMLYEACIIIGFLSLPFVKYGLQALFYFFAGWKVDMNYIINLILNFVVGVSTLILIILVYNGLRGEDYVF